MRHISLSTYSSTMNANSFGLPCVYFPSPPLFRMHGHKPSFSFSLSNTHKPTCSAVSLAQFPCLLWRSGIQVQEAMDGRTACALLRTCCRDWQTVITPGSALDWKRQLPSPVHGHTKMCQARDAVKSAETSGEHVVI